MLREQCDWPERAGENRGRPDPSSPRGLRGLPRNVWAVTLTSFLTDISSEMLVWLLPLFLSNVLGAPTAAIGLIEGAAETTASVLKVFSGWLSDGWAGGSGWRSPAMHLDAGQAVPPGRLVLGGRAGGPDWRPRGQGHSHRAARRPRGRQRGRLATGLAFGIHRAGDTAGPCWECSSPSS